MRPILFATLFSLIATEPAVASSTVSFEGAGYVLDFEVGHEESDSLAGVSFGAPAVAATSVLRPPQLKIEAFDTKARTVRVRYTNPGDAALPADFEFDAHESTGALRIQGRTVTGSFDWEM